MAGSGCNAEYSLKYIRRLQANPVGGSLVLVLIVDDRLLYRSTSIHLDDGTEAGYSWAAKNRARVQWCFF